MNIIIYDRITRRNVRFFNKINLTLKYDSLASSFSFNIYYNFKNPDHISLLEVGHFHIVKIEHEGKLLLTGYITKQNLYSESKITLLKISGYSLPGTLQDCNVSPSLYPIEFDNLNLLEITKKLIEPFSLGLVVHNSVSKKVKLNYEKTSLNLTSTIKEYLTTLATQRNIVLSHTNEGKVLFTQARLNVSPILTFDETSRFIKMSISFKGSGLFSEITAMKEADEQSTESSQFTVKNPLVKYVFRPKVVIQRTDTNIETKDVAYMALASDLKNIVLTITLKYFVVKEKFLEPNNLVSVKNPELSLFKSNLWFVESVSITDSEKESIAVLTCVLPSVYNNQIPVNVFSN